MAQTRNLFNVCYGVFVIRHTTSESCVLASVVLFFVWIVDCLYAVLGVMHYKSNTLQ